MTLIKRGARYAAGTVLLGLGLVPATASASAAAAYSCTATPAFPTVWNGGFDVQFVVTNTGTQPINAWVVTFDVPGGSADGFGGVVIGSGGTGITKITCAASFVPIQG